MINALVYTYFIGANESIGTLVLKFESQEKMEEVLSNQEKYIKVLLNNTFEDGYELLVLSKMI